MYFEHSAARTVTLAKKGARLTRETLGKPQEYRSTFCNAIQKKTKALGDLPDKAESFSNDVINIHSLVLCTIASQPFASEEILGSIPHALQRLGNPLRVKLTIR